MNMTKQAIILGGPYLEAFILALFTYIVYGYKHYVRFIAGGHPVSAASYVTKALRKALHRNISSHPSFPISRSLILTAATAEIVLEWSN